MTATESRRAPRLELGALVEVTLHSWSSVRVVDISMTGVLLETNAIDPSERLELLMPLGGTPFSAIVQIRRRQLLRDARGGSRVRLGGTFVDLDEVHRRQLAQFLTAGLGAPRTDRAE